MADFLAERGVAVLGLTTDIERARSQFASARISTLSMERFDYVTPGRFSDVLADCEPDLIFNFAAKATGQGMFDAPYDMYRLNGSFVVDVLEAIRRSPRREQISFCQASSSEMFGNTPQSPQTEQSPFIPKSPYGAAKLYAHNMVGIYRATYDIRCCSAILYNHESVRRSAEFVTKKIARGAAEIRKGISTSLSLGALDVSRDWGYAPEYVEAMYQMATAKNPSDYIVCSGRLSTVRQLCEIAFGHLGLDYRDYVRVSENGKRIVESVNLSGDPSKIRRDLGWEAKRSLAEIMIELVDHEMGGSSATCRA